MGRRRRPCSSDVSLSATAARPEHHRDRRTDSRSGRSCRRPTIRAAARRRRRPTRSCSNEPKLFTEHDASTSSPTSYSDRRRHPYPKLRFFTFWHNPHYAARRGAAGHARRSTPSPARRRRQRSGPTPQQPHQYVVHDPRPRDGGSRRRSSRLGSTPDLHRAAGCCTAATRRRWPRRSGSLASRRPERRWASTCRSSCCSCSPSLFAALSFAASSKLLAPTPSDEREGGAVRVRHRARAASRPSASRCASTSSR